MKTILPMVFVPAVVIAGLGFFVHAQEPARVKGTVLLLKTGRAMEGDIEKIGSQYCVRRGESEVLIAGDLAVRLCVDWDDAYRLAQSLIKPDNAKARIQLARWCHLNGLTAKALEQARKAAVMQPDNDEAKQLAASLERLLLLPKQKKKVSGPFVTKKGPDTFIGPAPTVDVSFETFVAFTRDVQPILVNTCVKCHANGEGGNFRLQLVSEASKNASSKRNLAAVLEQIDLDHPAISPLLVKAITPHGGAGQAAIRDRGARPLQSMQRWIEQTLKRNPQLKDYGAKKRAPATLPPAVTKAASSAFGAGGVVVSEPAPRTNVATAPIAKQAPPPPADEFSAEHFNRAYHPNR